MTKHDHPDDAESKLTPGEALLLCEGIRLSLDAAMGISLPSLSLANLSPDNRTSVLAWAEVLSEVAEALRRWPDGKDE